MVAILNGITNVCSAVNQTAVTVVQINITQIEQQLKTIQTVVQQVQTTSSVFLPVTLNQALNDTTINLMTQTVYTYTLVTNFLVVATKDAINQKPLWLILLEVSLAMTQSAMNAALIGIITAYKAFALLVMASLQVIIAASNATCNSLNTTTQAQINVTIVVTNATMNGSATFLPPNQQVAIANYTSVTITTMIAVSINVTVNITNAASNYISFCGNNITAAMNNITEIGLNATTNITQIMNTTSNRFMAVFCASYSLEQIQEVVSNASNYLGKCVTDGVKDIKNYTDECVKAYHDKGKNATDSINNCTKQGSHEKTDDEFKKCLEDGSDSDSKDLKKKLEEKSKKMEKGGENEKKNKKCKEDKEEDAYHALVAIVAEYQQCVAIFG